jgi:hypothetical protein
MSQSKLIFTHLFQPAVDLDGSIINDHYCCKLCENPRPLKQVIANGYGNLLNHIKSKHDNMEGNGVFWENVLKEVIGGGKIRKMFNNKAVRYYHWIKTFLSINLSFEDVDNADLREFSKFGAMCGKTIRNVMQQMVALVEEAISSELPEKFGLAFDGWSQGTEHFIGIFAVFPDPVNESAPKFVLLGFSPLPDVEGEKFSLSAMRHIELIKFVLGVFKKSLSNVIFLVGDNCSVNGRISRDLGVPLIGCALHRLNLEIKVLINIEEYVSII